MTSEPRPAHPLLLGWKRAVARAGLAFAVVALLGQVLAFGGVIANGGGLSAANTFRLGVVYFALFHGVAIDFRVPKVSVGAAFGGASKGSFSASYGVTLPLLLATALVITLLYRAGRAVADRAGGSPPARVLHGLKVAPVYAALSLGLTLLAVFRVPIPPNPLAFGTLTIRPSPDVAFLWPLVIAGAAGAAGAIRSGREVGSSPGPWGRRTFGALAGGWRMFLAALVLSFLGLLVQAAVQPGATSAYFRGVFERGPGEGAVVLAHHVLLLPNQSMFVLVPAMGGADRAQVLGQATTFLSYWDFPRSVSVTLSPGGGKGSVPTLPKVEGGIAPPAYLLYLLAPLVSVFLGGRTAARRGGAESSGEAAWLGAAAGVPFAVLVAVAAVASGIGIRASAGIGFALPSRGSVGPTVGLGGLLALVWGVAGGAVGGSLGGRRAPSVPGIPSAPAEST